LSVENICSDGNLGKWVGGQWVDGIKANGSGGFKLSMDVGDGAPTARFFTSTQIATLPARLSYSHALKTGTVMLVRKL